MMKKELKAFIGGLPAAAPPGTPSGDWPLVPVAEEMREYYEELVREGHPGLQHTVFYGRRWHYFLSFGAQRAGQAQHSRSVIDEAMSAAAPLFRLQAKADMMGVAMQGLLSARLATVTDADGRALTEGDIKAIIESVAGSSSISARLAKTFASLNFGALQTSGALLLWAGLQTFYPLTLEYIERRLSVEDLATLKTLMLSEVTKAMELREEMSDDAAPSQNGQADSADEGDDVGEALDSTTEESNA